MMDAVEAEADKQLVCNHQEAGANPVCGCVENLEKCNAECCKTLAFNIKSYPGDRLEKYYKAHGCQIKRLSRQTIQIIVHSICQQLENNLCKLHDTDQKPLLCTRFGAVTTEGYYIPDTCIYK